MKRFKLGLVLILASCQGDPSVSLDEGQPRDDWSELRRRMNVTVVDTVTDAHVEFTPHEFAQSGSGNAPLIGSECADQVEATMPTACANNTIDDDPTSATSASSCAAAVCEVQYRLCVAHRLMELADAPSSDRMVGIFEVPPLDQSTQAGFHLVAIDAAREAIIGAADALDSLCDGTNGSSLVDFAAGDDAVTVGESLAHAITEGYYLVHDAAVEAFDENLAIADESYSAEPSLTRAARRAYGAPSSPEERSPTNSSATRPALTTPKILLTSIPTTLFPSREECPPAIALASQTPCKRPSMPFASPPWTPRTSLT